MDAEVSHIAPIANQMRAEDKKECMGIGGYTPTHALVLSFNYSTSMKKTVLDTEGKPIAMFGVCPISEQVGAAWLLATEEFYNKKKALIHYTPEFLRVAHSHHPLLINYVSVTNTKSIRWLRWAGFSFIKQETKRDIPVYQFARLEEPTNV